MKVHIDLDSTVRPYEQLKSQIRSMAADGTLEADTRLPPVRQLAEDLGLAPGTVARAYRELEEEQVLITRGRHGSFVTTDARQVLDDLEATRLLSEAAKRVAIVAKQTGTSDKAAIAAVKAALAGHA
jgi:DNA-binding transcriptional regulator YhcF (GntR family)